MCLVCADGLLNGALEECRGCTNSTLIERSGEISCFGLLSGFLKCPFTTKPDKVQR